MIDGRKVILFGAGIVGRAALSYYGGEKVHCFADNNKAGQELRGKRIISFEELLEIHRDYHVVICAAYQSAPELKLQCAAAGIEADVWSEIVTYMDYESDPKIRKLKNAHKGERCFLIGNGPSLRTEDLDKLHEHGEISIGCNFIDRIFSQTKWRPDYCMIGDATIINAEYAMFANLEAKVIFMPHINDVAVGDASKIYEALSLAKGETVFYKKLFMGNPYAEVDFSDDVSRGIPMVGTVMYGMIQIAAYMGISKIYLLGVDGTQINASDPNYFKEKRHFYDDAQNDLAARLKVAAIAPAGVESELTAGVYRTADNYSREHGFRIYNATRGGVLDMFERVGFDTLF